MQYDRLGFPIPREFEPPPNRGAASAPASSRGELWDPEESPRRRVGVGKRFFVWALLLFGVVPAILLPAALPLVREAMVQWSLERAMAHEARDDVAAAAVDVGRALVWLDADAPAQGRLLAVDAAPGEPPGRGGRGRGEPGRRGAANRRPAPADPRAGSRGGR
jgi:hypothetical protein